MSSDETPVKKTRVKKVKEESTPASGQSIDYQKISNDVLEILKPSFKEFGDSIRTMVQNEVQALRSEIESIKKSPGVSATATGGIDINGILKEVGPLLNSLGIASPGGTSTGQSPNSLSIQSPGGGMNLGILQLLPDLLKMFGMGQQQNPMMSMMSEMMMRNFMAQQYRSAVLMDNIVANFVKNPDKLSEFLATSNSLVEDPIKKAAELMMSGQQPVKT